MQNPLFDQLIEQQKKLIEFEAWLDKEIDSTINPQDQDPVVMWSEPRVRSTAQWVLQSVKEKLETLGL